MADSDGWTEARRRTSGKSCSRVSACWFFDSDIAERVRPAARAEAPREVRRTTVGQLLRKIDGFFASVRAASIRGMEERSLDIGGDEESLSPASMRINVRK